MTFMNRQTIAAVLLASSSLVLSVPAFAQDSATGDAQSQTSTPSPAPGMPGGKLFGFDRTGLDTNGDGKISLAEIQAKRAAEAKSLDANGDGKISEQELMDFEMAKAKTRIEARVKARFAARDLNGDGELSAAELMVHPLPTRVFERMDRDGDGALSPEEIKAARKMMHERMGKYGHHHGKMDRKHHGKMEHHGKMGGKMGGQMDGQDGGMATPPAPPAPQN
ncbi:histidine kinase [Thioclava dalianensis]|uniref:Histidine kinase n=2 Tax=Thioclava dalianensis TaxID=1185766 RepID=A0A074TDP3_9RHOB|nr:hypothetical protein [Thioclava dalianensis]KEP69804.1 histidine kinase [Thioclava dalianensis]SFM86177.1 EF hand [Thioclava dalianensis]